MRCSLVDPLTTGVGARRFHPERYRADSLDLSSWSTVLFNPDNRSTRGRRR